MGSSIVTNVTNAGGNRAVTTEPDVNVSTSGITKQALSFAQTRYPYSPPPNYY
jgi:hypothetical protein